MLISQILPGFREFRTPLSVGYTYLFVIWLVFGQYFSFAADDGRTSKIYGVFLTFGSPAILASVTFAAYILGSVLSLSVPGVAKFRGLSSVRAITTLGGVMAKMPTSRVLMNSFGSSLPLSVAVRNQITSLSWSFLETNSGQVFERDFEPETYFADPRWRRLGQRERDRLLDKRFRRDALVLKLGFQILEETSSIAVRLRRKSKRIFDEYDRSRAEAEFRYSIAIPAGMVLLAAGAQATECSWWVRVPLVALGPIVAVAFLLRGDVKVNQSVSTLVQAMAIGMVSAPVMDPPATGFDEVAETGSDQTE